MSFQKLYIKKLNINYFCNGQNQPLIFLHGWGQSSDSFKPLITYYQQKYCVYAIDLPGFGKSDEPDYPYDIYDYFDIVCDFIEQLNIKNPIIIGHSFGGRIALLYGARNKNLGGLVITGGAGIKAKRSFKIKLQIYHYKFMKLLTKTPFYKQYYDDLVKNSGSSDYKNASIMMKKVLINVVNENLSYTFAKINVKTLLYWGDKDLETPLSDGHEMNNNIVNAELFVADGCGHYAYLENIADFQMKMDNFLEKVAKM